ncbi:CIC11C00000004111 [Sungouiella intermedia]|uniref:CIC11C00000004111 n=1 Tax=Sungouiella intermedia TaxID=45354 RepID=A0A1L0DGF0_9ASCO|nr:CIC11C00000004111 [[Candida] intermedia]
MAESDLLHYYRELKQFLDISDDSSSRAKSNSSRAQRAREKLLKLSLAQFRELSTDVYDELRRRIDELRSEPDFLLPKLTFHPKRNQARQKLSLLPQLRFKDLVSDISFEIERRNLHLPEQKTSTNNAATSNSNTSSHSRSQSLASGISAPQYPSHSVSHSRSASGAVPTTAVPESYQTPATLKTNVESEPEQYHPREVDEKPSEVANGSFAEMRDELATPDLKQTPVPQKSIGIQSNTVIPTKANLAWLSDEESDDDLNNGPDESQPRRLSLGNLGKNVAGSESRKTEESHLVPGTDILSTAGLSAGSKAAAGALLGGAVAAGAVGFGSKSVGPTSTDAENSEQVDKLKAENEKYIKDIESNKAEKEILLEELETIKTEKENNFDQLQTSKAEISKLSEEVVTAKAEIDRLVNESETLKAQLDKLEKTNLDLQNQYTSLEKSHGEVLTERAQLSDQVQEQAKNREGLPDPEQLALVQRELESVKAASAALRLENQSLKASQKELKRASRDLSLKDVNSSPRAVRVTPAKEVESPRDINTELKLFYSKLDLLASPKPLSASKEEVLRSEAVQWRTRYETIQAGKLAKALRDFKQPDLQSYVLPNGLVSLKDGTTFFALIDSFLLSINDAVLDNDTLFEKISNIAILSNKITLVGENSILSNNDSSEAVRQATTHALTATRYLATYPMFLPKIVVERAVSQVAFTMCDYLSVSKLYLGSSSDADRSLAGLGISPIVEDDVHVRPLKIGSKMNSTINFDTFKEDEAKATSLGVSRDEIEDAATIPGDFQDALSESLPILNNVEDPGDSHPVDIQPLDSPPLGSEEAGFQHAEKEVSLPTTHTSTHPKKLSLFERILNSKVLGADKNTPAEDLPTDPMNDNMKENIVPNSESPAGKSTSTFQGIQNASRSPVSPKKSSILERVKQFESPPSGKSSPRAATKESPSVSVKSARALFSKEPASSDIKTKIAESPEAKLTKASEADTSATPTRSRSIFQSLRERFTHDNSAKEADTSRDADISKNVDVDISRDEVAVSKDVDLEPLIESPLQVKERSLSNIPVSAALEKEEESMPLPFHKNENEPETTTKVEVPLPKFVGGAAAAAVSKATSSKSPVVQKVTPPVLKRVETTEEVEKEVAPKLTTTTNLVAEPESPLARKTEQKVESQNQSIPRSFSAVKSPAFKVKKVNYAQGTKHEARDEESELEDGEDYDEEDREEVEARQRQEYRKSMAAATFNFDLFDIDDPDNTLTQVLLYLEHQTVQVISTIQDLLSAIKKPDATRGELRTNSKAISEVISQMTEATNTSMNQTRNHQLKEHGSWVVKSLEDCNHRMFTLCRPNGEKEDLDFADKNFKQRLAGISFDIAKCTKELVKTVEEASLKEDIAQLDARLSHPDDLT